MANVQPNNNHNRKNSLRNRPAVQQELRELNPRDDIRTAFAGNENRGPANNQKIKNNGTHFKSRQSMHSRNKTPIR